MNPEQIQIGGEVFKRAFFDPEFRALALRDGTAAVEKVIGGPLPDGVKIRFVENDGVAITLGLPPAQPTGEQGVLSDAELAAVAGGGSHPPAPVPKQWTTVTLGPSTPGGLFADWYIFD